MENHYAARYVRPADGNPDTEQLREIPQADTEGMIAAGGWDDCAALRTNDAGCAQQ